MAYNFRFYAVRTMPRREKRVAEDILKVAKRTGKDVEQALFHPTTKGYVYVECRSQKELEEVLELVASAKGVVGEIPPGQMEKLFTVTPTLDNIKEYEPVLITQGPNKGERGVVEKLDGQQAYVKVDDGLMSRRLEVPLGWLERVE